MEPSEIWARAFDLVRRDLPVPGVWLAMQAAKALTIDGSFFVATLSPREEYLQNSLQDNQATTAIEEALFAVTGRVLAFRLIIGSTLADWEAVKAAEAAAAPAAAPQADTPAAEPPPAFFRSEYSAAPEPEPEFAPRPAASFAPSAAAAPASNRAVSQSWEKLSERLNSGYKSAPFIKYPHGQAGYVLTAVKLISDTMDVVMPPPGAPRDDLQERLLAKAIERLGSIVNLDPLFISLELLRYRESVGRNIDIEL